MLISHTFFHPKTIHNPDVDIAKASCVLLNRICVKSMAELIQHQTYLQQLIGQVVEVIDRLTLNW